MEQTATVAGGGRWMKFFGGTEGNRWNRGESVEQRGIGGTEGNRTLDLRIANGKNGLFMSHISDDENPPVLPKPLTKRSREQEIDY